MLEAVLDDIPPIRTPSGRRRHRPGKVHADKAYDHRRCRAYLRQRGIRPRIARRRIESSQRLGRHRWTIERTGAWLGGFRRLRIRYERCSERFYRWSCWPAQSSASTGSSSHRGQRTSPPQAATAATLTDARWLRGQVFDPTYGWVCPHPAACGARSVNKFRPHLSRLGGRVGSVRARGDRSPLPAGVGWVSPCLPASW
jgi:transposase